MTTQPEDFLPSPNDWLPRTLEYVGRCKVEFAAPTGSIEGPATVSIDQTGDVRVEMIPEADSLITASTSRYGLMDFFGGDAFAEDQSSGVTRLDPTARNRCTRLEVVTPRGIFHTEDVPFYGTSSVMDTGEVTEANFMVGQSTFEATGAGEAKYWVLPLTNFLSECRQWHPEINRHPLRIFPTPEVPAEITYVPFGPNHEKDKMKAFLSCDAANSKNRLIVFDFGEGVGFIERLPDYAESERLLLEGKERHRITALMVGPIAGDSVKSFERMRNWFSFDILSLLTLATGTEVGCPWVEIRDEEGRLVRRFHHYLGVKAFRKGYRLVDEIPLSGKGTKATGRLIECACSNSKDFGGNFLRAATIHLVRARYQDQTLDDQISHLTRGFETLCKQYGTMGEELGLSLNPRTQAGVSDILEAAATEIRALNDPRVVGPSQKANLDQIANRVSSANQRDNSFGIAVVKLLKHFRLPDAHILETYYQNRQGGWAGMLGKYRGDVTHHGYLPILEESRDIIELLAVRNHLHDALARVILKILSFDGGYNPGVNPYEGAFQVGWVKPHFSAHALGYGKED